MESSEAPVLIARFRSAQSAGERALQDLTKRIFLRPFLVQACGALRTLFGFKAPIVQKYTVAIKHFQHITPDDFVALFQEFRHILVHLETVSGQESVNPTSQVSPPPAGNNVFIIHGHDEPNTLRLHLLLQNHFHLHPIRMMGKAGMSRALLAKYEDAASTCCMAFALMTPDDDVTNHGTDFQQPRPNVFFEAGWFVGRLGIPRLCLLLKAGTRVQSDIDGISRIEFRDNIEEKVLDIEAELVAVGLHKR